MIPKQWLQAKVEVADVEGKASTTADPRFGVLLPPDNAKWSAMKAQMQAGDELWTFCSPSDSWTHIAGRAGLALVRRGEPVATIVTLMN